MVKIGLIRNFLNDYFHSKGLNEIYATRFIRSFALSIIGIFIPIYLLTIGHNLVEIALYYLLFYSVVAIFMPIAMMLIAKIGIKKVMSIGMLLLVVYYPLLNLIENGLPFYWPAIVWGISVACFWGGFHLCYMRFSQEHKEGKELSAFRLMDIIAGIMGPLVGGILIYIFSFNFVFFIVSGILVLGIVPLMMSKDLKIPSKKISIRNIAKSDTKKTALVYQLSGIMSLVSGVFWPIFIYLNVKNVIPLGIISSLTAFLMLFMVFYIGRSADKDAEKTLLMGIFLYSPSWISRLFMLSPMGLFFSNFYGDLTGSFISLPFQKMIYEKARTCKNRRDYFLFREFNLEFGRLFILIAVIFIGNLFWIFILTFFIVLGHLILIRKYR